MCIRSHIDDDDVCPLEWSWPGLQCQFEDYGTASTILGLVKRPADGGHPLLRAIEHQLLPFWTPSMRWCYDLSLLRMFLQTERLGPVKLRITCDICSACILVFPSLISWCSPNEYIMIIKYGCPGNGPGEDKVVCSPSNFWLMEMMILNKTAAHLLDRSVSLRRWYWSEQ